MVTFAADGLFQGPRSTNSNATNPTTATTSAMIAGPNLECVSCCVMTIQFLNLQAFATGIPRWKHPSGAHPEKGFPPGYHEPCHPRPNRQVDPIRYVPEPTTFRTGEKKM